MRDEEKKPKAAESFREDSKTAPSYVRVASASSSEFDEERAKIAAIDYVGQTDLESEDHFLFKLGFFRGARFQHAKDAEEIADWVRRDKYSQKVRTDQAEQIAELTEENQRLNRIILKELTENDELGCEYTYVNALRESNRKLIYSLKVIGTTARRDTNGKIQYEGDGYYFILKEVEKALAADEKEG